MGNREIKFRAYSLASEKMSDTFGINQRLNQIFNTDTILMQYTGLKDKNGVEIYEGDIIELNGFKYEVQWDNYYAMFGIFRNGLKHLEHFDDINCEIIGNINQNPELLNP